MLNWKIGILAIFLSFAMFAILAEPDLNAGELVAMGSPQSPPPPGGNPPPPPVQGVNFGQLHRGPDSQGWPNQGPLPGIGNPPGPAPNQGPPPGMGNPTPNN